MKKAFFFMLVLLNYTCVGQIQEIKAIDPQFDQTIRAYLNFTTPVISCDSLGKNFDNFLLLDAREVEEYMVSHLPGAKHIGHQKFDLEKLQNVPKDSPIVVYCSIGYRSEKIGESLQKNGFSNVSNLYGSIFEWVNEGHTVVDTSGKSTNKIHTYNRKWSKWVKNDTMLKIW